MPEKYNYFLIFCLSFKCIRSHLHGCFQHPILILKLTPFKITLYYIHQYMVDERMSLSYLAISDSIKTLKISYVTKFWIPCPNKYMPYDVVLSKEYMWWVSTHIKGAFTGFLFVPNFQFLRRNGWRTLQSILLAVVRQYETKLCLLFDSKNLKLKKKKNLVSWPASASSFNTWIKQDSQTQLKIMYSINNHLASCFLTTTEAINIKSNTAALILMFTFGNGSNIYCYILSIKWINSFINSVLKTLLRKAFKHPFFVWNVSFNYSIFILKTTSTKNSSFNLYTKKAYLL